MFEIVGPVLAITLITVLFFVVGMLYGFCNRLKRERDQWKEYYAADVRDNARTKNAHAHTKKELLEVRRLKDGYETALLEIDRWLSEYPLKQDQTPEWLKGESDETA